MLQILFCYHLMPNCCSDNACPKRLCLLVGASWTLKSHHVSSLITRCQRKLCDILYVIPKPRMKQHGTFVRMNITYFSSSPKLNYWAGYTEKDCVSDMHRVECVLFVFVETQMYVLAAERQKCGGIPSHWLQRQLFPMSAEATDGFGLELLGNW